MKWLMVLLALVASPAAAREYRLLDTEELTFETYHLRNHRDPYFPYGDPGHEDNDETWKTGVAAAFNVVLLGSPAADLYWHNRVHGEGTDNQMRQVGWWYELGLNVYDKVELFWTHHSQHLLDATSEERFPLDNFFGARLVFLRKNS